MKPILDTARRTAIFAAMMLAGCGAASVERSLTADLAGGDDEAQMSFWHTLSDTPLTSNDDAFYGLLLYFDGKVDAGDYPQRIAAIQDRGWLDGNFAEPAEQAVSRGTIASILVRALRIEGGLVIGLIGPHPRYAVRELQFQGIYPPSSPQQTFSGAQFVALIGRVEDYQRRDAASAASADQEVSP